jgi:hypothetical protein
MPRYQRPLVAGHEGEVLVAAAAAAVGEEVAAAVGAGAVAAVVLVARAEQVEHGVAHAGVRVVRVGGEVEVPVVARLHVHREEDVVALGAAAAAAAQVVGGLRGVDQDGLAYTGV